MRTRVLRAWYAPQYEITTSSNAKVSGRAYVSKLGKLNIIVHVRINASGYENACMRTRIVLRS